MKFILIIAIVILSFEVLGCHSSNNIKDEPKTNFDKLVINYINHSDNELIKSIPKNEVKWMLDDTRKTDTAKYFVFHIGHEAFDVNNGDTCCYRFTNCAWLYIDSLTRRVYEYDVQNDRLIKWDK